MACHTRFIMFVLLGAVAFTAGCTRAPVRDTRSLKLIVEEVRKNNRTACVSGCIVFEGDSNLELTKVQDYFTVPACNYAYRGSTTDDILNRKEKVSKLNPHTIILLVGGNDLIKRTPLEKISANYERIIRYYRGICDKVYCISNLPVHPEIFIKNDEMKRLNALIEGNCRRLGAAYIDVFPLLLRNGGLNPDYAMDPVHLNEAGRNVLMEAVKRRLK
ncbi:MAG: hypothetical protein E4G96_01150 [Chrysiogenales bacterium]|nr:MAG: hypothetical protein E4G96_01150 [Chrysiogenales bacterium]